MSDSDDRDWLDALAGRETEESATRREAQTLRTALRSLDTSRATGTVPDLGREAALVERALREGLIVPSPARPRPRWQLPVAASVLLLFAAGTVLELQRRGSTTEVVRGADAVVRIKAADPAALKKRILGELRAAGVEASGYEALGAHGIDADLPLPLSPQVKQVLDAHDIPTPSDGVLRIEIRKTE